MTTDKLGVGTSISENLQMHAGAYDDPIYQKALEHVWIHTINYVELAEKQGLHVFERAEGCTLYDARGEAWLDALAGLWVVNAGHGRAEIADAMAEQARKLAYVSSAAYTSVPAVQLAETLASITPGDLSRVFFSSGGSEAVETALKIAKQVQALRGFPKRYKIIARRGSYHGMTFGAMSLTTGNRTQQERFFGPLMDGVYHTPSPNHYRNDFGLEGEAGDIMCAKWVEQEILFQGPETVAAVIGEPISSSNGVHIPSPKYWQLLREICNRHNVLLIADEVITGFGRTGHWFGLSRYGVEPDILSFAKAITSGYFPLGGIGVNDRIAAAIDNTPDDQTWMHAFTYSGHPVGCAVALANLDIIESEGLVQRAAELGARLLKGLQTLAGHKHVGDVRGLGLMAAVEFVADKQTKAEFPAGEKIGPRVHAATQKRGLFTRLRGDVYNLAPAFVTTEAQIDRMVEILGESIQEVLG